MARVISITDTVAVASFAFEDAFPGVQFTATHTHIDGRPVMGFAWTDGPSARAVITALDAYTGVRHNDNRVLLNESWWCDTHRARLATVNGKPHRPACCKHAELVRFDAAIHTSRTLTEAAHARLAKKVTADFGLSSYWPEARPIPGHEVTADDILRAYSLPA